MKNFCEISVRFHSTPLSRLLSKRNWHTLQGWPNRIQWLSITKYHQLTIPANCYDTPPKKWDTDKISEPNVISMLNHIIQKNYQFANIYQMKNTCKTPLGTHAHKRMYSVALSLKNPSKLFSILESGLITLQIFIKHEPIKYQSEKPSTLIIKWSWRNSDSK